MLPPSHQKIGLERDKNALIEPGRVPSGVSLWAAWRETLRENFTHEGHKKAQIRPVLGLRCWDRPRPEKQPYLYLSFSALREQN